MCKGNVRGSWIVRERELEESIWWKKTTKKFSNKTETFPERASDKKSFYSVADVRSEE